MGEVTQLLLQASAGDRAALDAMMLIVDAELRDLSAGYLRNERAGHTLQPTALVNEAYLRLIDQLEVTWQNHAHFLGVAALMMHRILVNYAEARNADKRGGGASQVTLDDAMAVFQTRNLDVIAVDEALTRLAATEPRKAQIMEMRFFGGLTVPQIAGVLNTSVSTVERDYTVARAWLQRELSRGTKR